MPALWTDDRCRLAHYVRVPATLATFPNLARRRSRGGACWDGDRVDDGYPSRVGVHVQWRNRLPARRQLISRSALRQSSRLLRPPVVKPK
jgi:hypothetical protein